MAPALRGQAHAPVAACFHQSGAGQRPKTRVGRTNHLRAGSELRFITSRWPPNMVRAETLREQLIQVAYAAIRQKYLNEESGR